MDIERIGENKIRCALTEEEIRDMGFDIDEIIGNSETTQKFMRVVLGMVEEREDIDMEEVSPMVKAELLQDHSMAITFGEEGNTSFKNLVDTMNRIIKQLEPERLEELKQLRQEEVEAPKPRVKAEPMLCALRFASLEDMMRMSRVCFPAKVPKSSLYKLMESYYLVLDFTGFSKEEMRPFAFGTVEYDDGHYSDMAQIAHIREHGSCILRNEALQMLMGL